MTIRAQITLNPSSGLPRDAIVNTFHYDVVSTYALARAAVNLAVGAFYNTIDTDLSALILQTGHTLKHFNLDDTPPRIPFIHSFNFDTATSANRLPGEVACVVSTAAAPVSGIQPASLRNRFFLGPLSSNTLATTGLIAPTIVTKFANAAQTMFNSINASGEAEAVIYSPTRDEARPMVSIFVNNEFDTQRRRGRLETERQSRGITGA